MWRRAEAGVGLAAEGAEVAVVAESTDSFYGISMTAGDIYPIAATQIASLRDVSLRLYRR